VATTAMALSIESLVSGSTYADWRDSLVANSAVADASKPRSNISPTSQDR